MLPRSLQVPKWEAHSKGNEIEHVLSWNPLLICDVDMYMALVSFNVKKGKEMVDNYSSSLRIGHGKWFQYGLDIIMPFTLPRYFWQIVVFFLTTKSRTTRQVVLLKPLPNAIMIVSYVSWNLWKIITVPMLEMETQLKSYASK